MEVRILPSLQLQDSTTVLVRQCILWLDQSVDVNKTMDYTVNVPGKKASTRGAGWRIPLARSETVVDIFG